MSVPEEVDISGFGGTYEAACHRMIEAGAKWLAEHPKADPKFVVYQNVFGICNEANDDAKALSAVVEAAAPDCTGAMHQAVIGHLLRIRRWGWDEWVRRMRKAR